MCKCECYEDFSNDPFNLKFNKEQREWKRKFDQIGIDMHNHAIGLKKLMDTTDIEYKKFSSDSEEDRKGRKIAYNWFKFALENRIY